MRTGGIWAALGAPSSLRGVPSITPPTPGPRRARPWRAATVAIGTLLVATIAPVTAADARRPATTSQKRAIAGPHPACWRVYISSIDRHYASIEFNASTSKTAECAPLASNGLDISRRDARGHWRDLGGTSDCSPGAIPKVPARVYRELTRSFCRS